MIKWEKYRFMGDLIFTKFIEFKLKCLTAIQKLHLAVDFITGKIEG